MERETRSDIMFRHLNEFLESKEEEIFMILFKNEVKRLEKHLDEHNIAAKIVDKMEIESRKLRITIRKKM